jgi:nucleoside phosphorylase
MTNDLHTKPPLDVLIVTAVRDEYEAVLMVDTGAMPASAWQRKDGPAGREISFRAFRSAKGIPVRFAVTYATSMGQVATTDVALSIVGAYRVRCLAMCGVCAGRWGKVNLGDVIVADRLYEYDTGKLVVEYDETGNKHECFNGDLTTYNLDASWKQKAEGWSPDSSSLWISERPFNYDNQAVWLLDRLFFGDNPEKHQIGRASCRERV